MLPPLSLHVQQVDLLAPRDFFPLLFLDLPLKPGERKKEEKTRSAGRRLRLAQPANERQKDRKKKRERERERRREKKREEDYSDDTDSLPVSLPLPFLSVSQ